MEAIKKITKKLEQEKDKANSKYIIICKFCKKPIKKVIAPKSENEISTVKSDSVIVKRLIWKFNINNNSPY